jgi:hypothetical protein
MLQRNASAQDLALLTLTLDPGYRTMLRNNEQPYAGNSKLAALRVQ